MAANELPPMIPGGQWLRSSADREPQYIVGEAHIKRLIGEGWQPADDPRQPVQVLATEQSDTTDAAQDDQASDDPVKRPRKPRS